MNRADFLRYLRVSGYIVDNSKHEEIDFVVSLLPIIVSDKSIDERNNTSLRQPSSTLLQDTSKGSSLKQRGKYIPTKSGNKNMKKERNTSKRTNTRLKKKNALMSNKGNLRSAMNLKTSTDNSSFSSKRTHTSLTRTPPQTPINISNKLRISCYMDSVIQCLYWTPGFTRDFLKAEQKEENTIGETLRNIGETFRNIIENYEKNSTYYVEQYTSHLIDLLRGYFYRKTGKPGQQDSQDFLIDLLSILTKMYYERPKVPKSVVEEAPVPDTVQNAINENQNTETHSFIQDLFQSTVIRTYTCQRCEKKSFKAEYQEIFTLEFGNENLKSVLFTDLLDTSFREEDLGKSCESEDCIVVSNILLAIRTKKNRNEYDEEYHNYEKELQGIGELRYDDHILHKKQLMILKPAKNLIISFKRFKTFANGKKSKKINTIVINIPFQLNLNNVIYDNKDIIYDLYAFIHHSGDVGGGHYINYVKIEDDWWFVDDAQTARRVITDTDVKLFHKHLAESYILFYTKIE